ncbi:MAG TPA: hypothetical protein VHF06_16080, partial [Pseudonocardiaceae bacterium]|nr:hypothetical protein [Pseudonocardiaceae bacterium]
MGIRVAMVVGSMDARHDGVADYAGHLARALGGAGVDVTPVVLTSLAQAGRRIRDVAPDVVHVQFAAPAAAARVHGRHRRGRGGDRRARPAQLNSGNAAVAWTRRSGTVVGDSRWTAPLG